MVSTAKEFSKGSKLATIQVQDGRFVVWAGYSDQSEGTIPARFFKGFSTCSNDYKTETAAIKAVNSFLGH